VVTRARCSQFSNTIAKGKEEGRLVLADRLVETEAKGYFRSDGLADIDPDR